MIDTTPEMKYVGARVRWDWRVLGDGEVLILPGRILERFDLSRFDVDLCFAGCVVLCSTLHRAKCCLS
jgi:hypothetical protein